MIERKIIARDIMNLTDARYFAAWMVEYMSFDISAESEHYIGPNHIKEIMDWLEGPIFIGDFSGHTDSAYILEACKTLSLDGLITDQKSLAMSLAQSEERVFFSTPHFEALDNPAIKILAPRSVHAVYQEAGHEVFLDREEIVLSSLEEIPMEIGLSLRGGEEIKTGLKSFDELDEIYDYLIEE